MKIKKVLLLALIICLTFSCTAPAAFALEDPQVDAEAIIVADVSSGNILYEKNMNDQRSPASLTKIMTGLLAVEAVERGDVKLDTVVTAAEDCRQGLETDSSTAGIVPGEQLPFQDVLYCAMVVSANEACNIIGTTVSGSIQNFVNDMNRRARELGCMDTLFSDTNGLINENHYTTAHDLFLISREAMRHPLFVTLVSAKYYVTKPTNVQPEGRELNSSNALITPDGIYGNGYIYDGASGIKTGFTKRAGYCLVSTAKHDDRNLMVIVMGCRGPLANNPQNDYGNFTASIQLYNWAFDNFSYRTVVSAGQALQQVDVQLASEGAKVILRPDSDVRLLLPNDIKESDIDIQIHLKNDPLTAPIEEDEVLGAADILIKGSKYASVSLITFDGVRASGLAKIKSSLKAFFSAKWLKVVLAVILAAALIYLILLIRYRYVRRKHLRNRMQAAEQRKRQEQKPRPQPQQSQRTAGQSQQRRYDTDYEPTQRYRTPVIEDSEPTRKFEALDPSQREPDQSDLDELIRSLGLDKDL